MTWTDVSALCDIQPDRGVAALVGGRPVAVFRLAETNEVFVVDHIDPATGSPTMARGLVGSSPTGTRFVAAPLHKQRFDLATGTCLDDESLFLEIWPAEVIDGRIRVALVGARPAVSVG